MCLRERERERERERVNDALLGVFSGRERVSEGGDNDKNATEIAKPL